MQEEEKLLKIFFNKKECINLSNTATGGNTYNKKHPKYKEICAKISATNKGKKISQETLDKIKKTKSLYIYKHTKETLQLLSFLNKGNKNCMFGKNHSKDSIHKMKESKRKTLVNFDWINLETGEEVRCTCAELDDVFFSVQSRRIITGRIISSKGWYLKKDLI